MAKGILIVMTNPPSAMEEEFNAWYNDEHIAERLAVPGFERARRYYVTHAERRYLALYDMASIEVLDTPAYHAVTGVHATPWTKRVVPRCAFIRVPATQVSPGETLTSRAPRLLMLRFSGATRLIDGIVDATKRSFEAPQVHQARVFQATETDDVYVMVEGSTDLAVLLVPAHYGDAAPLLDLVNCYAAC